MKRDRCTEFYRMEGKIIAIMKSKFLMRKADVFSSYSQIDMV